MAHFLCRVMIAAALLTVDLAASAMPTFAARPDRREQVGEWQVEEVGDAEGSRVLHLLWRRGRHRLDYEVVMWSDGATQKRGATYAYGDCRSGERSGLFDPATLIPDTVRGLIGEYMRECHTPAADAVALLAGFDAAFARLETWRAELSVALVAARGGSAAVQFDNGQGFRDCSAIRGRLRDARASREARQAPGAETAVVGTIPAGAGFAIRASYEGWLEVAFRPAGAAPDDPEVAGWISGEGVAAESQAGRASAVPRETGQSVLASRDGRVLAAHAELEDIIACEGAWMLGRWRVAAPGEMAWIPQIEIWADPVRVEAWVVAAAASAEGPPVLPDRRLDLGDWLVESVGEEELSRATRVSRSARDLSIRYDASFWHGNAGPYFAIEVAKQGMACGGDSWRRDPAGDVWREETDVAAAARDVRARLETAFAGCGASAGDVATVLAGLEPVLAFAAGWAEDDRRHVLAVADWIANDSVRGSPDRQMERVVGGWRVLSVTRSDGSAAIQIDREAGEAALEYGMQLYRHSPGSQGWSVRRGRCGRADSAELTGLPAPDPVRERLASLLAACSVPEAEATAALEGFGPAFDLASVWARATAGGGSP